MNKQFCHILLTKRLTYIILFLGFAFSLASQNAPYYYFKFEIKDKSQLDTITNYISIDNYKSDTVWAYANSCEWKNFTRLGIPYTIIPDTLSKSKVINMGTTVDEMATWDKYPTYEVYVQLMEDFASNYPNICQLEEIGTLASGRKLLAIKISDNVTLNNEAEPELLYTSSIHGDELTGAILLLRLAEYLLNNYGDVNYPNINTLINNSEIWINPLANPNGTYYGGNSTVASARRTNANSIDLNRNFPDPEASEHPDGNDWQEETTFMMAFADLHHFTLSGNFHGGAEVFNYPWDTWSRLASDDNWWQMVAREYADSLQENSPAGYFTDENNGITNGYAWYTMNGGRQDYMNYFHNCREATFEISSVKLVSSDELPNYWTYNKGGLIAYLLQGLNGVKGMVTNPLGEVLEAQVTIEGHDMDNAWIKTDARAGDYNRYLKAGNYNLTFSNSEFDSKTINSVSVLDNQTTELNVILGEAIPELLLNQDTLLTNLQWNNTHKDTLTLNNIGYAVLNYSISIEDAANNPWINLNSHSGTISPYGTDSIMVNFITSDLIEGTYECNILITGDSSLVIPVTLNIVADPIIELSLTSIDTSILVTQNWRDTLIISNTGNANLNYTISIENSANTPWLTINTSEGIIPPDQNDSVAMLFDATQSGTGNYTTNIKISGDIPKTIPIHFQVDTLAYFKINIDSIAFEKIIGEVETKTFSLENPGGIELQFTSFIDFKEQENWLNISPSDSILSPHSETNISLTADCQNINKGVYSATVEFYSIYDTISLPVHLNLDTLTHLLISKNIIEQTVFKGQIVEDTILLSNTGDGFINIAPEIIYRENAFIDWIIPTTPDFKLYSSDSKHWSFICDSRNLPAGNYQATLFIGNNKSDSISIAFKVLANPNLEINKQYVSHTLKKGTTINDTIVLYNSGDGSLSYSIQLEEIDSLSWLSFNKESGELNGKESDTLILILDASNLSSGQHSNKLLITTNTEIRIPIILEIITAPILTIDTNQIIFNIPPYQSQNKTLLLTNKGDEQLIYEVIISDSIAWLTLESDNIGAIEAEQSRELIFTANSDYESSSIHKANITLQSNANDTIIKAEMNILVSTPNQIQNSIYTVFPNPFNEEIRFSFNTLNGNSTLHIFNLMGHKIKSLNPASITGNKTQFIWNGTNHSNSSVPKGVYLFQYNSDKKTISGFIQKQ